jgi:hypothetical protein
MDMDEVFSVCCLGPVDAHSLAHLLFGSIGSVRGLAQLRQTFVPEPELETPRHGVTLIPDRDRRCGPMKYKAHTPD